jgi:hypothetical protein
MIWQNKKAPPPEVSAPAASTEKPSELAVYAVVVANESTPAEQPSASASGTVVVSNKSTSTSNLSATKPRQQSSSNQWTDDATNHLDVKKGYVKLSEDGRIFYCLRNY